MHDLKIFTERIEDKALSQIHTLLSLEAFSKSKVRIMPDVHAGCGCVIGFTADLGEKVIPNVVGVDIGCGMYTLEIPANSIDFERLDGVIRAGVPAGMNVHRDGDATEAEQLIAGLHCCGQLRNMPHLNHSLGTLGGGNHFIEVDRGADDRLYLIIHSGSRNLGKQVCDIHQNIAVENCHRSEFRTRLRGEMMQVLKATGRMTLINDVMKAIDESAPNRNIPAVLCYLEGDYRRAYLDDMKICQQFARRNRERMAEIIFERMGWGSPHEVESMHTVHNYIDHEQNIVRKGAISARRGEKLLIPMNMRDGCILGIGKGNDDWNQSAPHGAGRLMSRSAAKETLELSEYRASMQGIFTTSVCSDTLDEAPMVYKPMESIVNSIGDTVEIIDIIKPVYNFKAAE